MYTFIALLVLCCPLVLADYASISGGSNASNGSNAKWGNKGIGDHWPHNSGGSQWSQTQESSPQGTMALNTDTSGDTQAGATSFSSERSPKCSKESSSWDKQFLTATLTAPPLPNPFADIPFLSANFPLRTDPLTYTGNPLTTNPNNCCGTCSIYWPEVTLHYWPQPDANTACLASIASDGHSLGSQMGLFLDADSRSGLDASNPTVLPGLPQVSRRTVHSPIITPGPKLRRDGDGNSGPSTIITNGHTFVSPSIYLEIPIVHASDACGPVGKQYTNVLWSYQPVDISSVQPASASCWPALLGMDPLNAPNCKFQTKSFDFADLPCPAEELRKSGDYQFVYNTAAEYEPVLVQPYRMQHIDPEWTHCSANIGWDPMRALTPLGGLLAPPRHRGPHHPRGEREREEPRRVAAKRTQVVMGEGVGPTATPGSVGEGVAGSSLTRAAKGAQETGSVFTDSHVGTHTSGTVGVTSLTRRTIWVGLSCSFVLILALS